MPGVTIDVRSLIGWTPVGLFLRGYLCYQHKHTLEFVDRI